jgi:KDO2-lipid IV(A) lauroyltransferase
MLFKLIARLPFSLLYRLADLVYLVSYYLVRYRRTVVYQNLQRVFPTKSHRQLVQLSKAFYRNLADVLIEAIKAYRMSEQDINRRVHITNPELLQPYFDKQQSVILLATHQCNWEWLLLASCTQLPFQHLDAVYKKLHAESAEHMMLSTRSRFGAKPIPTQNTIIEVMKRRQLTRILAMVADQSPARREEKFWAKWFNQDTAFAVGVEKIVKLTKYPVFFIGMRRIKRGYYEAFLEPLAEPPYSGQDEHQILTNYSQKLEQLVEANPSDWLWSYRKWKYKKSIYY